MIRRKACEYGAEDAVVSEVWEKGGKGGINLAKAVVKALDKPHKMRFLYPTSASIKTKIRGIATKIYGASSVEYSQLAEKKITLYTKLGYSKFPINMAKTHHSISHNSDWKGAPSGYRIPVRDIRVSVGAGFIYPLLGAIKMMPGLPSHPAAAEIDIDKDGETVGLF